jgi:predicted DNA-binding protein (MmcQ/YjbR family)
LNKTHWNSAYLQKDLPKELLMKMIDEAHELIFKSLTKKAQKELLGA